MIQPAKLLRTALVTAVLSTVCVVGLQKNHDN